MGKANEIPTQLKEFWGIFEKLAYSHNYSKVFDDFLTITMTSFTLPGLMLEEHTSAMADYTSDEKKLFNNLYYCFLQTFDKELRVREWVDLLGDLYQTISSSFKQSSMGQFFTPVEIVEVMIRMNFPNNLTGKGVRVNDPACGSGRLLIAFHAYAPGNYVFAEDLDYMCCKMSCINLVLHGCEGQVIWHDSLAGATDYKKGWKINSLIRKTGIPSILPMKFEESFLYRRQDIKKEDISAPVEKSKVYQSTQLSIF